jgi:hypothetical protein
MTGIHYITPLGRYIMPQWHFLDHHDPARRWGWTRLEFYEAPAPWGPWVLFHAQDFDESWYNPCLPSKFISADGTRLWMFVAGDFMRHHAAENYYGLHMIPVTLHIDDSPDQRSEDDLRAREEPGRRLSDAPSVGEG